MRLIAHLDGLDSHFIGGGEGPLNENAYEERADELLDCWPDDDDKEAVEGVDFIRIEDMSSA